VFRQILLAEGECDLTALKQETAAPIRRPGGVAH
jgi:hypothetical protein